MLMRTIPWTGVAMRATDAGSIWAVIDRAMMLGMPQSKRSLCGISGRGAARLPPRGSRGSLRRHLHLTNRLAPLTVIGGAFLLSVARPESGNLPRRGQAWHLWFLSQLCPAPAGPLFAA